MFKKLDVSGDGTVSVQELQSRMASLPAQSRDHWQEVMDEIDRDGSGDVQFDEFDAVVRTCQTRSFARCNTVNFHLCPWVQKSAQILTSLTQNVVREVRLTSGFVSSFCSDSKQY